MKPYTTHEMSLYATTLVDSLKDRTHSTHDALVIATAAASMLCDDLGIPARKRRELINGARWEMRDRGAGPLTQLLEWIADVINEFWKGWRVTVERLA